MSKLNNYSGSIDLISGLRQKNNGDFPLLTAHDVQVDENGKRLDTKLANVVDKSNITLGLHTDGLIYLFVDGVPVGNGIALPEGGVSGDVVGNVDSENNIVLMGNLLDGTYTLKYENEDGTYTDVGTLQVGKIDIYYSITKNLTNCTISNGATSVIEGESYSATITANDGYVFSSIVVTMGGENVTVTNGVIDIANVTGNIVITATAEAAPVEIVNLATPDANASGEDAWNSGGWCNNSYMAGTSYAYRSATDGRLTTNTFAVEYGDTIYIKGIKYAEDITLQMALLDASKTLVKHGMAKGTLVANGFIKNLTGTVGEDYWQFDNKISGNTDQGVRFIRIAGYPSGDISDIIITRNQPIV